MTMPCATSVPSPSAGVPMLTGSHDDSGKTNRSAKPAATAPSSWAMTYIAARAGPMRPVIQTANVTAGLKWPPETAPSAETSTASARPWASATPTSPPLVSPVCWPSTTAPIPTKKKRKVPIASATRADDSRGMTWRTSRFEISASTLHAGVQRAGWHNACGPGRRTRTSEMNRCNSMD